MPMEDKFGDKLADPEDPRRCQSVGKHGQCSYARVEGGNYCYRHGGASELSRQVKANTRMYNLQVWRSRMNELKGSDDAKNLTEEIAILRLTMEAYLEKCQDSTDLMMYSSTVGDLATKIERLVKSCHSLQQASGQLMDRTKAINFASTIVEIIDRLSTELIKDEELREHFIDKVSDAVLNSMKEKE